MKPRPPRLCLACLGLSAGLLLVLLPQVDAQDAELAPAPQPQPLPAETVDAVTPQPMPPDPAPEIVPAPGIDPEGLSGFLRVGPSAPAPGDAELVELPPLLTPWVPWVSRDFESAASPPRHDDPAARLPLWLSRMELDASAAGAEFRFAVEAYREAWVPLPGGGTLWPVEVRADGVPAPVVERDGGPTLRLAAGRHEVEGRFEWPLLPQELRLPKEIGLLALRLEGEAISVPGWERDGTLWLQRGGADEEVAEDYLSVEAHSLLEDGIPLWFTTRLELIVSGKSREQVLGHVLPAGWQLSEVESPLPVAVDEDGLARAQIRSGRWSISVKGFRIDPPEEIGFAEGAAPPTAEQTLAYRSLPSFRQAEIRGLRQIDASQTQVPDAWRSLPVYYWESGSPFALAEQVRGRGEFAEVALSVRRSFWLDEDGSHLTFQDRLGGAIPETRRLDAAEGYVLGSVVSGGEPQLVTHHPETAAPGFELRSPILDAVATGRVPMGRRLQATGWLASAGDLSASLELPPGYRLFALFGPDYSHGDWLSSWSLLDLFLLMLFTLAVYRLRGWGAAALALAAFGLAYHEPGAPRFAWLFLLVPVALLAALPAGGFRHFAKGMKWVAVGVLVLGLAPFAAAQLTSAIYLQLERAGDSRGFRPSDFVDAAYEVAAMAPEAAGRMASVPYPSTPSKNDLAKQLKTGESNLRQDPAASIQTGPGVPEWSWRRVEFGWDGPVAPTQEIQAWLIPPPVSRLLYLLRPLALVLLAAMLLAPRKRGGDFEPDEAPPSGSPLPEPPPLPGVPEVAGERDRSGDSGKGGAPGATGAVSSVALLAGLLLAFGAVGSARAQFPPDEMLEALREHLVEERAADPVAADLALAVLRIEGESYRLELEYHSAGRAAVPLPAPLSGRTGARASLATNSADGASTLPLVRIDGELWALLPEAGIHGLVVEGVLAGTNEWEWSLPMKPRRIEIEAPGWTVGGLRADGTAEEQILFSRAVEDGRESVSASYERLETRHALIVERRIELGLVWRVRTTVRRLTPGGRAVSLRVPLLEGERLVTAGLESSEGAVELRLAAGAGELSWEGELVPAETLALRTRESDTWSERWRVAASPVWNVAMEGLPPTFELEEAELMPLWMPWPGEEATLRVSRPRAVEGAAITIDSATHRLVPGRRQRSASLDLSLRTSLGEEFPIRLPEDSEIVALRHDGQEVPVRRDGGAVVVTLRPGDQRIQLEWRRESPSDGWTHADAIALPVESSNLTVEIVPRQDQWLLWAIGPQRGPAFRLWGVLAFALLVAAVLAKVPASPLRRREWLLLALGLTQIPAALALTVVGWLFLLGWRGSDGYQRLGPWRYNLGQVLLLGLAIVSVGAFVYITSVGLLGRPEMLVAGNGSSASRLVWFSPRTGADLEQPGYLAISIWWYRLAMLAWALWLAAALVRWLVLGWKNSSRGGHFRWHPRRKRVQAEET